MGRAAPRPARLQTALHAHLTPGGGFQGGALAGSAVLLIYLGEGYRVWRRICRTAALEFCEALAGGGFVLCGLAPLLEGGSFLENRLPLGQPGELLSAGTIPLLNLVAGVAVAAGFALAIGGVLQETRARAPEPEP